MTTSTTCGNCGSPLKPGSAFCDNCGTQTGDPTAGTVALAHIPDDDPLLRQLREELAEDYEVERELGRGGMAIVYKGTELMLDRVVAIKVLPPEMAHAGDTPERFKREARLAASLDHANIIPIYRVGQKGDLYFMAMKFVEGRALDSIIEIQGALPFSVIMRVLEASASALAFAHERGIVHRDIKGGNILVDTDGRVLVSDFGIARAMGETGLTATGMVIGTPSYMSPEQCGGKTLGPQSDQYSLGILAFQMLTGQLPFEADSIMGVIQHHYLSPVPDILSVRKGVPEELLAIVHRMLEKKSEDRFAKTSQLVDVLAAVPETDLEKKEGVALLKELSHGKKIDLVRTGSLPPIRVTEPTRMPKGLKRASKRLQRPAKKKRRRWPGVLAGTVVLAGTAGAVYQFGLRDALSPAPGPAPVEDTVQAPGPVQVLPGLAVFAGLPADATINIGGRVYGDRRIQLDEGTYQYSVSARGYRDYTATFNITPGQETLVRPQLVAAQPQTPVRDRQTPVTPPQPAGSAPLRISTDPIQATVLVDGQQIGSGRVFDHDVPAGRRRISVRLAGYRAWDTTLTVVADQPISLGLIRLQPEGGNE